MRKIIISDTSCFIVLSKIGELDLLYRLYGNIFFGELNHNALFLFLH
jgi:predicted nucleic acid-binding protein